MNIVDVAKKELANNGSFYSSVTDFLYSQDDWNEINSILANPSLPWEQVYIGDADELNDLTVARFMTDIERPTRVNQPLSDHMISVVCNEKLLGFVSNLLDGEDFYIRRMQVNKMKDGSFIGKHLDIDSNPDYLYSIVLQLGKRFAGGEFLIFNKQDEQVNLIRPELQSIVITDCSFPHQVEAVTEGERVSLVFFVSKHAEKNRRVA
ncbi:2OG-Fe(II) oxygenase [Pseudomonas fuscovaginae UPB0736]|uniref:2OG-Fe(II) oxygenase superfamily protein n=2 Tax=Pseudomonas asplenii TaxID=53407 RepID=A0A1H6NYJ1_9PSED|nr:MULTISPECIES: 2OG-Fe(II) oxygenase [Pseudomonas]UUQ65460.1 2OG-Fe(II) oxygenase [Pseudomonas fuscovaginae UPB0736]UZE31332.1 2OG-Fe(II) oxygenase [Pseudomonas asplenii]SEI18151.1 2OG-Fe(II) oxygenase superfamily protein [Pseudomonas fuscovaginae]